MATILSAEFGDERSTTNVLSTLQSMYKSAGKLDVPVNSSLIPMIVKSEDKVVLSDQEVRDAKEKAISACGGASDSMCVEKKSQEFQYSRMKEKQLEQDSGANILKGRRLRVRYKDENGKIMNAEVPEGQHFKFGGKPDEGKQPFTVTTSSLPSLNLSSTALEGIKIGSIVISTFLWVFSVLLVYISFNSLGYDWWTVVLPLTVLSIVVPTSGFVIVLIRFIVMPGLQKMAANIPKDV